MKNSKTTVVVSTIIEKIQLIVGIILLAFFGLCVIMGIVMYEDTYASFMVFCIILTALGALLILLSRKRHKLIVNFKKYVTALSTDPTGSISNLAASMGTSEDVVTKDLDTMIQKKYFSNAYIDRDLNCVIVPHSTLQQTQVTSSTANASITLTFDETAKEMVTVSCKGCGGMNTVPKGQATECEFCGSTLQG